jgi:hypothetical protein
MENNVQLREELKELFDMLKTGGIEHKVGKEMNNSVGKMLNSVKLDIIYAAAKNEAPNIRFLEDRTRKTRG